MDDTEDLKNELSKKEKERLPWNKGLSTGSTLLNLACSNRANVGMLPGHFYWVIGASESGKSVLSMTCFMEATKNKHYDKHRLIYDNAEDGMLMDLCKYFGPEVEERLEPPRYVNDAPCYSTTVEEFYFNVDDAFDREQPFVYVLDSMDALDCEDDEEHFQKKKKANRKGKTDTKGNYGTAKAKANSNNLRRVCAKISRTDSILIIVSQTRSNIGFGAQFNPETVSGGKALKFFATWAIWTTVREQIVKEIGERKTNLGILTHVKFAKNRLTGQKHRVEFPLLWDLGIDDVGSMVDWLIEENFWKKSAGIVTATGLDLKGTRDGVIAQIEEKSLERDLQLIVSEKWTSIVEASQLHRKRRYE